MPESNSPSHPPKTLGVILAGGLARRLGGGDKSLRLLGGVPIIDRVIGILRPQCTGLLLNANGDPTRFAMTGLPVVADSVPDFPGPLAGILAALDWTASHRPDVDWVVSAGSDTPFLPPDLVQRLFDACEKSGSPVAQAESDGRAHPVNALWKVALRHDLRRALVADGERKVAAFAARHGVVGVGWPVEPVDPFFNINTPDDLAEAERLLRCPG